MAEYDPMLDKFTYCGVIYVENGVCIERLEAALPKGCAVYAFRQAGEWLYIGSAASGARGRLSG